MSDDRESHACSRPAHRQRQSRSVRFSASAVHRSAGRGPLGDREAGGSLVEFALICPLLCALLFGIFSFGVVYDTKLALTAAAREGARYGATVTPDQAFASGSWAENVRDLVVSRSTGALDDDGSTVCVSLVSGSPARTHSISAGTAPRSTAWFSTNSGGTPCDATETYPITANDDGLRVQVVVTTPGEIQAIIYSRDVTLRSKATVQSESAA